MRPRLCISCCAFLALVRQFCAADLTSATQPLIDGVPQVAVVRLRAFLEQHPAEEEKRAAILKLAQALTAADQPNESLSMLDDSSVRDLPAANFLRGQSLAALSRWDEALPFYEKLADDPKSPFQAEAILGRAETLRALGRIDDALQAYNLIARDPQWNVRAHFRAAELLLAKNDTLAAARELNSSEAKSAGDRKELRYLRGCVEMQFGNKKRATTLFASILKSPQGATHSLLLATLFAIADMHLRANTPDAGDDFLEEFTERHPDDSNLPAIFAKLDQLYAAERRQGRHDLGRWAHDPAQPRRALAQWYLARAELRLRRRDIALQIFDELRAQHPAIPELAGAFLENAQLLLEDHRFEAATAALEVARSLHGGREVEERIGFLAGRLDYAAGNFEVAAMDFQRVALISKKHSSAALLNESFAALRAGDGAQLAAANEQLKEADAATRGEVGLEQALAQAGHSEKNAPDLLRNFITNFPKHPRISEAWVALAELAFHASPPRLDEARQDLKHAAESPPTAAAQERSEYLAIWIEEAAVPPNETKVIDIANEFLQKYADSSVANDVRLKLAEIYYRRQDFASAQTQFTLLAQQNPNGPLAEKAQFFSAQSARQSMAVGGLERALTLFDEVVKKNGELKWAARNEQAVIERKLAKNADAMTLYEEVLKGDAKNPEKREALCGKGDILYELGASNSENYKRAAEVYEQLAKQSEVGSHWHNQALCKKGMCQEKLNQPTEALATFYQIVEDGGRPDKRREFFWFYKAGFNAARLLEEKSSWQPAAAIYQKLSFAGGPRSDEAKTRLKQLRLEHYLWEQ